MPRRERPHRQPRRGEDGDVAEGLAGKLTRAQGKVPRVSQRSAEAPKRGHEVAMALMDEVEEPEVWEGTAEPPTETDVAAALSKSLDVRAVTDIELDQLWDWARKDRERVTRFLSINPQTSVELRERTATFGEDFYSLFDQPVDVPEQHVGFVVFLINGDAALMRFYLADEYVERTTHLLPQLMRRAQESYPEVRQWTMAATDPEDAKRFRRAGFEVAYMLTWNRPKLPDVMITPGEGDG